MVVSLIVGLCEALPVVLSDKEGVVVSVREAQEVEVEEREEEVQRDTVAVELWLMLCVPDCVALGHRVVVALEQALPVPRGEVLVLGEADTVPAAALPEPEAEAEAQGLALLVLLGQLLAERVTVLLRDTVAH